MASSALRPPGSSAGAIVRSSSRWPRLVSVLPRLASSPHSGASTFASRRFSVRDCLPSALPWATSTRWSTSTILLPATLALSFTWISSFQCLVFYFCCCNIRRGDLIDLLMSYLDELYFLCREMDDVRPSGNRAQLLDLAQTARADRCDKRLLLGRKRNGGFRAIRSESGRPTFENYGRRRSALYWAIKAPHSVIATLGPLSRQAQRYFYHLGPILADSRISTRCSLRATIYWPVATSY